MKSQANMNLTGEQGLRPQSTEKSIATVSEQLALPLTDEERAASWKQLHSLHRGNRFRLMFGLPNLPENVPNGTFR
jgi:hypothetical protein